MYHVDERLMGFADVNLVLSRIGIDRIKKWKKIAKEKSMSKEQELAFFRKNIKDIKNNDYAMGVVISRVAYNLFYEKIYEEIKKEDF